MIGLEHTIIESTVCESDVYRFVVTDYFSDCRNLIIDWRCDCYEQEKTGVPCPHLIMTARSVPEKSYVDLFNPRWQKHLPEFEKPEYMWVKRGRGATTRTNMNKRKKRPLGDKRAKGAQQPEVEEMDDDRYMG